MRRLAVTVMILMVIFLMAAVSVAKEKLSDEEKLAKGWIVSYVDYEQNDQIAVLDVKALINATPKSVWYLLSNINGWSGWTPVMSQGFAIKNDIFSKYGDRPDKNDEVKGAASNGSRSNVTIGDSGKTVVNTYEEFDLPWPINNDWVLRRYTFDASQSAENKYSVVWKQLFKGAEGRGGSWNLSQYNGKADETLFEYHFKVKRKDGVPMKVFEVIIGKTIDRFISAIRRNVNS